jgi:glycosyltransferase involved in cell wall biosynthesis
MDDLRWFAPSRLYTLPVPSLRRAGLRIAQEGDAPAGAAVASDADCAVAAFRFALRHRCPLLLYVWDLPPWRLGAGKPHPAFEIGGRVVLARRPWGGYPERSGYYSRIRYVATHATEVWCPSAHTVEDVRRRFGVEARRMPFCYDSERFRNEAQPPLTAHRSPLSVVSISRLVPHKNHALILRAAARCAARPQVRILGRGVEAASLRRLAAELGIALDLTDTWATDDEVLAAYRAASVVVCPSSFEGFGLTPIEALAAGAQVIASDIPPHREFLDGAVRFFPAGDGVALAAEIGAAIDHPPSRPAVQSPVLSDLTIEACAARMFPGLERILACPP